MAIDLSTVPWSPGLGAYLDALGISVWFENRVPHAVDEQAAQAAINAYTLEAAQSSVAVEIDAHAKALIDRVVAPYSAGEMAAWPIMRAEAMAMLADLGADTPNIDQEAAFRQVDRTVIRDRVLANSSQLQGLRAAILGTAGRHKDAVRALVTHAQVAAYDWREGWPL